jgi:hypothetical protein
MPAARYDAFLVKTVDQWQQLISKLSLRLE